jgi:hypothetical protein
MWQKDDSVGWERVPSADSLLLYDTELTYGLAYVFFFIYVGWYDHKGPHLSGGESG